MTTREKHIDLRLFVFTKNKLIQKTHSHKINFVFHFLLATIYTKILHELQSLSVELTDPLSTSKHFKTSPMPTTVNRLTISGHP